MRYLALPRLRPLNHFSKPDPKTGRIAHYNYLKEPWYNPSSFATRWNLEALLTRITGGMIPGDGGAAMKPEGFLFEDLGPKKSMCRDREENNRLEEIVRSRAYAGCPFSPK